MFTEGKRNKILVLDPINDEDILGIKWKGKKARKNIKKSIERYSNKNN